MPHEWTLEEIAALVGGAAREEDCWAYCAHCGGELATVEPDATEAWCELCEAVRPVDGLRRLGLM